MNNKRFNYLTGLIFLLVFLSRIDCVIAAEPIIIDHTCTDISQIPDYWIEEAKKLAFHFATRSHGSQIISGLQYFEENVDPIKYSYAVRTATTEGLPASENPPALRMYSGNPPETYINKEDYWNNDPELDGASDALTRTMAVASTGNYDFSMWAWSYDYDYLSVTPVTQMELYLSNMDWLESQYPEMKFIYMTGPANNQGGTAPVLFNSMIRDYVTENNKVLFDVYDIETHDPDGTYHSDAGDSCNWCIDWCQSHPEDCETLPSECAHSDADPERKFNCTNKARAFWWMMARLAGWNPSPVPDIVVDPTTYNYGKVVILATSDKTITVTNTGSADLLIGTIAGPAAPFTIIADNCSGQTIAPGGSRTLTVRFAPTSKGLFSDSFDIPSDDPDENPVTISVSGTGTSAKASQMTPMIYLLLD